jgi:phosphoglycolate phosphatase
VPPTQPLFVFDLDGTLVDSHLDLAESANELLEGYGAAPLAADDVTAMVGEGARVLVERALAARAVTTPLDKALEAFLEIYERRLVGHTRAYSGVRETFDALRGHATIAVLTNKPGRHTRLLLEALDLARDVSHAIGGDEGFPRKPDPASLRHVMTIARATPQTTVMVGDSLVDVETAARAGTRLVVALYGFGKFDDPVATIPPGSIRVADPEALPDVCRALLRDLVGPPSPGNPT